MNVVEYKQAVIGLFQCGNATPEQWEEMATAVLQASESGDYECVAAIDETIDPDAIREG